MSQALNLLFSSLAIFLKVGDALYLSCPYLLSLSDTHTHTTIHSLTRMHLHMHSTHTRTFCDPRKTNCSAHSLLEKALFVSLLFLFQWKCQLMSFTEILSSTITKSFNKTPRCLMTHLSSYLRTWRRHRVDRSSWENYNAQWWDTLSEKLPN